MKLKAGMRLLAARALCLPVLATVELHPGENDDGTLPVFGDSTLDVSLPEDQDSNGPVQNNPNDIMGVDKLFGDDQAEDAFWGNTQESMNKNVGAQPVAVQSSDEPNVLIPDYSDTGDDDNALGDTSMNTFRYDEGPKAPVMYNTTSVQPLGPSG